MSTEGWIFIVGFRVFDIGLLVAWLIWFFRIRDDGDDPSDDGGGGGGGGSDGHGPGPRRGPGGGGLRLPGGRWPTAGRRIRDGHSSPARWRPRRGRSVPGPLPARVRFPGARPVRISPRR
ncbi:MAG TPA: hypothetical protein VEX36_07055 [Thermoleophilaceae bacterium]|nr:hypothetical protein [Thermoleophilaceae bacterium]